MFPRSRRVLGALAASSLLLLAACGDAPEGENASGTTAPVVVDGSVVDTAVASDPNDPTDTLAPLTPAAPQALPKPAVAIPAALPTKLVITDLSDGSGKAAVAGDTVVVHYVGVRSADGTEFDNSYDRGEPFPVVLGSGSVIPGWEEGLLGSTAGGRRQLDIPPDMAYGDTPQGDIIQPGDALTFVVDVLAVIPVGDPANAPTVTVKGGANVVEAGVKDLEDGEGDAVELGDNVAIQIISFRADTGEQIDSSWETGQAFAFIADPAQVIPGLANAVIGMKLGGRRQVQIPYLEAFGELGQEQMGLPPKVDLTVVIDLIASY
jgi:peptidylprolyl isomerase